MKSGELQCVRGCAFPLGREMWKHTCAVLWGWRVWPWAGSPTRLCEEREGSLICSGAEWLELEFWRLFGWFQFRLQRVSAESPGPCHAGCCSSVSAHLAQACLQKAPTGYLAQCGSARMPGARLLHSLAGVGASSVQKVS